MSRIHIALVGREALPVFYTVAEYNPDMTYFVGTSETQETIRNLQSAMAAHELQSQAVVVLPYDIRQIVDQCEAIHAANGEAEYIYNITGGTKLMAVGAMLCAQRHGARMVYTDSASITDLATFKTSALYTRLDTSTIFTLQGQKVRSYSVFTPDAARRECAQDIATFIRDHIKAYNDLMNYYLRFKQIPKEYETNHTFYQRDDSGIYVEYDNVEVLSTGYRDAFSLLFDGRWWETLVAETLYKRYTGRYEMWTNVRFKPQTTDDERKDKNEVDILLNIGNTLLFVECKSGAFDQNNIYKLESVCQTYGGYKSRGVIVAFQPNAIKAELLEKARDRKIDIIVPDATLANLGSKLDTIINSLKA